MSSPTHQTVLALLAELEARAHKAGDKSVVKGVAKRLKAAGATEALTAEIGALSAKEQKKAAKAAKAAAVALKSVLKTKDKAKVKDTAKAKKAAKTEAKSGKAAAPKIKTLAAAPTLNA
ncbi:MAG: hypothetical protein P4L64_06990 [Caulobacteraceae bacterium]|nr:hypothetical protein [Caulobacteraceae bacterium]